MLTERIQEEINWPGRPVRARERGEAGSEGEDGPEDSLGQISDSIIDPSRAEEISRRLNDADRALRDLESEALQAADEAMADSVEDRPQTAEALKYLAGTHPDYDDYGGVPGEDRLEDDSRITGQALARGYDVLEHADRNAFRVDLKEEATREGRGETRRYNRITSPAEATGSRDPGREGEGQTLGEAFEKTQREKQISMGRRVFWLVGSFLLKALAKGIRSIARSIENAFNISIPLTGFTLGLGKYIAAPLHMAADWLKEQAERLMEKAMGYDPTDRSLPQNRRTDAGRGEEAAAGSPDHSARPGGESGPSLTEIAGAEPDAGPQGEGMGPRILEAGGQVLRAAEEEAQSREDKTLARALRRYDKARTLRRDLEAHKEIAVAWGADPDVLEGDGAATSPSPATDQEPVADGTEQSEFEKC